MTKRVKFLAIDGALLALLVVMCLLVGVFWAAIAIVGTYGHGLWTGYVMATATDDSPCPVCGGHGWHTAGGNDPSACGRCPAGEAWATGGTRKP